jgi:adenylate cyclase
MSKEIERRFLVDQSKLPKLRKGKRIVQGYFNQTDPSIRVRIVENEAFLTIKSYITPLKRNEFEFKIPINEGKKLLTLTKAKVEKVRTHLKVGGKSWSIDFFKKENFPLCLAEVELINETEPFEKPLWVKKEVTFDQRFFSLNLAFKPWTQTN